MLTRSMSMPRPTWWVGRRRSGTRAAVGQTYGKHSVGGRAADSCQRLPASTQAIGAASSRHTLARPSSHAPPAPPTRSVATRMRLAPSLNSLYTCRAATNTTWLTHHGDRQRSAAEDPAPLFISLLQECSRRCNARSGGATHLQRPFSLQQHVAAAATMDDTADASPRQIGR